jgi:hypothetical protein
MNYRLILSLLTIFLISGCSFLKNTNKYNDLCQTAIRDLINEDYEKVLNSLALDKQDSVQIVNAKTALKGFRKSIIDNFGEKFDLKFVGASKQFSTEDNVQDVTTVVIQLSNQTHYGYFDITMNDSVGKMKTIYLRDFKDEIPNTLIFWLLGIIPISILGLNIYTIRKIFKSDFSRKWILITICIVLNWPTLNIYLEHYSLEFAFQILFGVGFNLMGYDNYVWSFGIPLGALISLYAIRPPRTIKKETEIIEV